MTTPKSHTGSLRVISVTAGKAFCVVLCSQPLCSPFSCPFSSLLMLIYIIDILREQASYLPSVHTDDSSSGDHESAMAAHALKILLEKMVADIQPMFVVDGEGQ